MARSSIKKPKLITPDTADLPVGSQIGFRLSPAERNKLEAAIGKSFTEGEALIIGVKRLTNLFPIYAKTFRAETGYHYLFEVKHTGMECFFCINDEQKIRPFTVVRTH